MSDNRNITSSHDWFDNPAYDQDQYGELSFAEANDYRILRECIEKYLPYVEDDVAEVAIWCEAVKGAATTINDLRTLLSHVSDVLCAVAFMVDDERLLTLNDEVIAGLMAAETPQGGSE